MNMGITCLITALVFGCCKGNPESKSESSKFSDYPIKPVNIRNVKLTDDFWLPIIRDVQEKTIRYSIQKCKVEERFDNFLISGKAKDGSMKGLMPFDGFSEFHRNPLLQLVE